MYSNSDAFMMVDHSFQYSRKIIARAGEATADCVRRNPEGAGNFIVGKPFEMQNDECAFRWAQLLDRPVWLVDRIAIDWINWLDKALDELRERRRLIDNALAPALVSLPGKRSVQTDADKPLPRVPSS